MPSKGALATVNYIAWSTSRNSGQSGDKANHTLRWIKDGSANVVTNSPVECDQTFAPGVYALALTAGETNCDTGTLAGTSNSAYVVIIPTHVTFELLPKTLSTSGYVRANVETWIDTTPNTVQGGSGGKIDATVNSITTITGTPNVNVIAWVGNSVNALQTGKVDATVNSITTVSGAVGSVTGNVGGNVTGSIGAVTAGAQSDIWTGRSLTELAAVPGATPTAEQALMFPYMALRNLASTNSVQTQISNDAGTKIGVAAVSDDTVTFQKGKFA